jgi:hypothetical protein
LFEAGNKYVPYIQASCQRLEQTKTQHKQGCLQGLFGRGAAYYVQRRFSLRKICALT